jgi:serine/threonine-protein kinase
MEEDPVPVFPGDFEEIRHIATGGFGAVYRARGRREGRIVALKCFRRDNEGKAASFQIEKLALKRLYHPNIVKYYGDFTTDLYHVLELDFIDGSSLRDQVPAKNNDACRLKEERILEIVFEIALALEHSQERDHSCRHQT